MKLINLEYTLLLFDGLLALKTFGDVAYHQILLSYLQSMDNTSVQYLSSYLNTLMMLQIRKSTRLNSSHVATSYAVFCLKKKTKNTNTEEIYENIENTKDEHND